MAVTVTTPDSAGPVTTKYWLIRTDVFDCDDQTKNQRRRVIDRALQDFGLEAWKLADPLPVTLALPRPEGAGLASLGPPGRFCLGLPTEQSTGLPVHVDARFFAKINRDGVNFDQADGYNELLLEVALELFANMLRQLQKADELAIRRAATLALHRPPGAPGALAERVYADDGIADGEVILSWSGERFLRRSQCALTTEAEYSVLSCIESALAMQDELLAQLPEQGLLVEAREVLETIELPGLRAPDLVRCATFVEM